MQSFGRAPELQVAKLQEVAARSPALGRIVEKMLTKDPAFRISSAQLADELNELQPGGGAIRGNAVDESLLKAFTGITIHEVEAVQRLRRNLDSDDVDLSEMPNHIGGDVALLRVERIRKPSVEFFRTMLAMRAELCSDKVHREILEQGLTLQTLPGTAEASAATFQMNEWLCTDTEGDIVQYRAWGSVVPAKVIAAGLGRHARWNLYRQEARGILVDLLSRRAQKVVRYRLVISAKGVSLAHRKFISFRRLSYTCIY